RRRRRLRFVSKVVLACAAGLVAIAIVWRLVPAHRSPRKENVAQGSANLVLKATLDFQKTTVERGPAQPPNPAEIPRLKRPVPNAPRSHRAFLTCVTRKGRSDPPQPGNRLPILRRIHRACSSR